jgi:hypothetical protein
MVNEVATTETMTIIIMRRYRCQMGRVWRAGPMHGLFSSDWASPTRALYRAWAVASAHSASPTRHDYIFLFYKKNVYIYMYNLYSILKTLKYDVLLVR